MSLLKFIVNLIPQILIENFIFIERKNLKIKLKIIIVVIILRKNNPKEMMSSFLKMTMNPYFLQILKLVLRIMIFSSIIPKPFIYISLKIYYVI